jgi:pimeloyl-ACP methyl ester carboxylesterase
MPRAELRQKLALMPEAISELAEARRLDARLADYRQVAAATLIMRGKGRATGWPSVALARLAETIPQAEIMTFPELDHIAPEKKPGEIAGAVLRFFAWHAQQGAEGRSQPAPSACPGTSSRGQAAKT